MCARARACASPSPRRSGVGLADSSLAPSRPPLAQPHLRRMVYLFLKEVAESTSSEEIIIVVASLTKDINSPEDLYRGNAIRVLAKIIDVRARALRETASGEQRLRPGTLAPLPCLISLHCVASRRVAQSSMLGQLERYIRQAVVDKSPLVASSALLSAIHFWQARARAGGAGRGAERGGRG